jgi:glycosyltransferase involved in cell wall biosynthesis
MPTSRMRIAIVSTYPPGTGSLNEYAYHFVRFLRQKAEIQEILLLVDELPSGQQYPPVEPPQPGKPATRVMPCWCFDSWRNLWRIWTVLRREKPDIVLFNVQFATFGSKKIAAFLGLLTPIWVHRRGLPTMVLLHNLMDTIDLAGVGLSKTIEPFIRFFGRLMTRLLLTVDLIAVTLPKYVDLLEQKYGAKNVLLIPHGAFEDVPFLAQNQGQESPMIMTFGKFGTYKKVELLIEAFQCLLAEGRTSLELVIAGTDNPNQQGYLASVQQQYAHVPGLHFIGYVPEDKVAALFQHATVVVFPYTSTTGSSGVLHQAGQYGKATVLPNIEDLAEVISEEGYTGKFFTPGDKHSLACAIAELLDNPTERYEIEQQNYLAATGLPIDDMVDWYLFHFRRVIDIRCRKRERSA